MEAIFIKHPIVVDILTEIENYCNSAIQENFSTETQPLQEMLKYHLGFDGTSTKNKGKRIRPLLVCLTAHLCGANWHNVLPAAVSIELIHNFSLIHDDIQDQSLTRHDRETLWVNYGIAQSINAGDSLFSLALNEIWKLSKSYPINVAAECSKILTSTCMKLTEGQFLDIDFEKRTDVTPAEYQFMIEGKTTALIAACTRIGALLGTCDRKIVDNFELFGKYLGLAFQIMDDYLGIWGDPSRLGKSTSTDLESGKMTYPVVLAINNNQEFADRYKTGKIRSEEIPSLLHLLERSGIAEQTITQADFYTNNAITYLRSAAGNHSDIQVLLDLTHWLLKREV
jgi:geranylgeranyl diphosphate synthase, type I